MITQLCCGAVVDAAVAVTINGDDNWHWTTESAMDAGTASLFLLLLLIMNGNDLRHWTAESAVSALLSRAKRGDVFIITVPNCCS